MGRLEGKVAFISGAGSGIARAAARLFAQEGAKVAIAEFCRDRCDKRGHVYVAAKGGIISLTKGLPHEHFDVRDARQCDRSGTGENPGDRFALWEAERDRAPDSAR